MSSFTLLILLSLFVPQSTPQWIRTETSFLANGSRSDDLALSGSTVLLGAGHESPSGITAAGMAFVYVRSPSGWNLQAGFTSPVPTAFDDFGKRVALDVNTAAVAAPSQDAFGFVNSGAVHVFERQGTSWTHQAELMPVQLEHQLGFGDDLALDGDTLVVGTPGANLRGMTDAGAAFVLVRSGTTWTYEARLESPNPEAFDRFGLAVAIEGDTAIVTTRDERVGISPDAGAVHVFVRSAGSWSHRARLTSPTPDPSDGFGWSAAISGDTVVVGAFTKDVPGAFGGGAVYVYQRSGTVWSHAQTMWASDVGNLDLLGYSVAIDGDRLIAGAKEDDNGGGQRAGSAYVFTRSGGPFAEYAKLVAGNGSSYDYQASAVDIEGTVVATAAEAKGWYEYDVGPGTPQNTYCTAGTSGDGCRVFIASSGVASATASTGFFLHGNGGAPNGGMFMFGTNGRQANSWGNGTSYNCVVPPIRRGGFLPPSGFGSLCEGDYMQDLNARWTAKPNQNPGAGATVQAQLWYRDPFNTSNQTTSLSDAIEFGVAP